MTAHWGILDPANAQATRGEIERAFNPTFSSGKRASTGVSGIARWYLRPSAVQLSERRIECRIASSSAPETPYNSCTTRRRNR
jgi:hypothetical protein